MKSITTINQSVLRRLLSLVSLAAATSLLGFFSLNASAQEPSSKAGSDTQLEEIIVTGTKRELSLQDVPAAVSVITSKDLQNSVYNDVRSFGDLAPGFIFSPQPGFNATGGGMRGAGSNIIVSTQDQPVSFLVDDFPHDHVTSQFVRTFDIEQVEVFHGPQGTLFGKNTTGGVIAITTKRPVLGEYSGEIGLDFGGYTENGNNFYSIEGALNVPLTDTLALRIAAIADNSEGYFTDDKTDATFPDIVPLWEILGIPRGTPLPPEGINPTVTGTGRPLGGIDVFAAKAKLLWEPSDTFSAYLITEFVRDRSGAPVAVNDSPESDLVTLLGFPGIGPAGHPNDPYKALNTHSQNIRIDDGHPVDVDGAYLHLDWTLPKGILKSISSFRSSDDRAPISILPERWDNGLDATRNTNRDTWSQELRFVSDLDGPFNFVAGASVYHDELEFLAYLSVGVVTLLTTPNDPDTGIPVTPEGFVNLTDTRRLSDFETQVTTQDRDDVAFYVDGTYDIGNDTTLSVGIRHTNIEKDFSRLALGGAPCNQYTDPRDELVGPNGECLDARSHFLSRAGITTDAFSGEFDEFPLGREQFFIDFSLKDDWSDTTYRVALDHSFSDTSNTYLSYSTGFLSGGISEACSIPIRCAYDPETVKSFELGHKLEMLSGRLRLNAAAYLAQYEDLQKSAVATFTDATGNIAQEATTVNTGTTDAIGVDVDVDWLVNDSLELKASINYLNHDYTSGVLPDLGAGGGQRLEDFETLFSPDWKAHLAATYRIEKASGAQVALTGSVNYQGEFQTDVFNRANSQGQARTLVFLGATYTDQSDRYSVTAYVDNAFDDVYRYAGTPVGGLFTWASYGAPRSIGVKVNTRFGD
ncbi:MAG: TonB-dependent receptor [Gammaproteobacteria bacterium]|nr:TonB-dependent receptor [Gammaproteobacteria bacterium]